MAKASAASALLPVPLDTFTWPLIGSRAWYGYALCMKMRHLHLRLVLAAVGGTHLEVVFARWLGANIGRHVHLDCVYLAEHSLLEIGDGATITCSALTPHYAQPGGVALAPVVVGAHATIMYGCSLQHNVRVAEGVLLQPYSAGLVGCTLASGTWGGFPAERLSAAPSPPAPPPLPLWYETIALPLPDFLCGCVCGLLFGADALFCTAQWLANRSVFFLGLPVAAGQWIGGVQPPPIDTPQADPATKLPVAVKGWYLASSDRDAFALTLEYKLCEWELPFRTVSVPVSAFTVRPGSLLQWFHLHLTFDAKWAQANASVNWFFWQVPLSALRVRANRLTPDGASWSVHVSCLGRTAVELTLRRVQVDTATPLLCTDAGQPLTGVEWLASKLAAALLLPATLSCCVGMAMMHSTTKAIVRAPQQLATDVGRQAQTAPLTQITIERPIPPAHS